MRVVLHPAAELEFAEAVAYYTALDRLLGQRFYREMMRLIQESSAHPGMFRQFDPPARRHFSPSFPYGVIYLELTDHIWIVAVMHLKRKPGYWKARVE